MKLEEYDQIVAELEKQSKAIRDSKRPAYTLGKKDVLTNFKEVASRLGITPMQVWGCYFLKHIDSITSYVRDVNIPQAEPLVSRFCDARNYLDLGYALLLEKDPDEWVDKLTDIIINKENSDQPLSQEEFEKRMKDYEDSLEKERRIRKVKRYQAHF